MRVASVTILAVFFLVACEAGSGVTPPSDVSAAPELVRDAGAGDTGAPEVVDCDCEGLNECCDGCAPIRTAERSRCETGLPGQWGYCASGACVPAGRVTPLDGELEDAHPVALALSADGLLGAADAAGPDAAEGASFLWSAEGALLRRGEGPSLGLAFSPDGLWLAVGGPVGVEVQAVADGGLVQRLEGAYGPVAFSPDGAFLAAGTPGGVGVWETANWLQAQELPLPEDDRAWLWSLAFSPDGGLLAAGRGQAALMGSPHGELTLWELPSFAQRDELDCTAWDLAFSPDGGKLAAACWSYARIWDLEGGRLLAEPSVFYNATAVAWSPSGESVALGTFTGGVFVYALADFGGEPERFLPAQIVRALRYVGPATLAFGAWSEPFVALWEQDISEEE